MLDRVPEDIWTLVFAYLHFRDVCCLRLVSRPVYATLASPLCDSSFAQVYAEQSLGDAQFWHRALSRPVATRRELPSFHREIARIEAFALQTNGYPMRATTLYRMWKTLDAFMPTMCPPIPIASSGGLSARWSALRIR